MSRISSKRVQVHEKGRKHASVADAPMTMLAQTKEPRPAWMDDTTKLPKKPPGRTSNHE